MRVLIACEYSGTVREAFKRRGHDAWSCDLLPTEIPGKHIEADAIKVAYGGNWDLMIAHPPCTYLSYVGNRHWKQPGRDLLRAEASKFFIALAEAPIKRICTENPLGYASFSYRKYDQIIHPYYFGERKLKRTCLWLKNLPKLWYWKEDDLFGKQTSTEYPEPTYVLKTNGKKIHHTEAIHGGHERSKFWEGIANAMADQWGNLN